jgi:TolB-like protein/DNA-binding winged helix-turn-helix (wHTH) protein/Tfp pilus assembly protein PilF
VVSVATAPASGETVLFEDFEANLRSRELRRQGSKVRLPDQSFQVLAMLLAHPGDLVAREDIRKTLWPNDTFVDFDHGLNNAVSRLREALGDPSEGPRFIETLPRRGYRFIGTLKDLGSETVSMPKTEPRSLEANPTEAHRVSPRRIAVVGAVLLILFLAFSLRIFRRGQVAASPVRSLVVLPLENLSGDPSEDYFADGMTDALITDLANISSLRVVSRTSAMHYKGSHQSLPEIARELKVDAVVEGSVIRSGSRVRVNAKLVQAYSDRYLWAKAYERDASEILELQQNLAQNIVREIQAQLTPAEQSRLANSRTVNPAAYEASLKGRYYWNKRSRGGFNKGLALFEQAAQADATYAPAYAGMANCYNFLGLGMGSMSPRDYASRAKAAAQKALELDEALADAHAALAFTLFHYDWNWPAAEQEYRRALELDPQNAIVRGWYADLLSFLGRADEAKTQRQQIRDLDPFSIQGVRTIAGAYGAAEQYGKAIDYYKKEIESEPDSFRMRMDLGGDYLQAGRYQDAAEEFQRVLTLYGPNVYPLARLGYSYALWGKKAEADRILGLLKKERRPGYVSYAIAEICEALGRKEEALLWLEKAYDEGAAQMIGLKSDFDSLHSDPRFQDLVRRVGAPSS